MYKVNITRKSGKCYLHDHREPEQWRSEYLAELIQAVGLRLAGVAQPYHGELRGVAAKIDQAVEPGEVARLNEHEDVMDSHIAKNHDDECIPVIVGLALTAHDVAKAVSRRIIDENACGYGPAHVANLVNEERLRCGVAIVPVQLG